MTRKLTQTQHQDFQEHCNEEYPREAVGYINSRGRYVRLENTSEGTDSFRINSKALSGVKNIQALLHSHPYDTSSSKQTASIRSGIDVRTPSIEDCRLQEKLGSEIGFGIVAATGEHISAPIWLDETDPIEGRDFIYRKNDCLQLVFSHFRNLGIELKPHYDYQWEWWINPTDEGDYLKNFKEWGFVEIDKRLADPNDILLIQPPNSTVPCHIGVYINASTILHHLVKQKSGFFDLGRWMPYVVKVLRYNPQ